MLDPLSEPEAEALLELLSGETELAADLFTQITEAAEGNPLYVEQMLAMLTENGSTPHDLTIPPTIHALLAARLDRLEPEERAVIERAAVIGKEFWRGAIAELTPEAERGSSGPSLMTLARKEFIEPGASIFPEEDGFRFRHILIRDAAYLGIPKETRAQLHERFAGWLERTAGERASELDEIIGYHLEQAHGYRAELGPGGDSPALAARARGAARGSRPSRDRVPRGRCCRCCAHLAGRRPPPDAITPERPALLVDLGQARMRTGDFAHADEVLTEALEAATAAGDRRLELRTTIEREFFRTFTEPEGSALDDSSVADRTIPLLEELGDDEGLAKAWLLKSEPAVNAGRWGARAEALERALEHARRAGDTTEIAALMFFHAQALYYGRTPVPEALARCEQYLAEQADDRLLRGLRQHRSRGPARDAGRLRRGPEHVLAGPLRPRRARPALPGRDRRVADRGRHRAVGRSAGRGSLDPALVLRHRPRDGCDQRYGDDRGVLRRCAQRRREERGSRRDLACSPRSTLRKATSSCRCSGGWHGLAHSPSRIRPRPMTLARDALARARDTDWPDLQARALVCLAHVVGPGDEQSLAPRGSPRGRGSGKGTLRRSARLPVGSVHPA